MGDYVIVNILAFHLNFKLFFGNVLFDRFLP